MAVNLSPPNSNNDTQKNSSIIDNGSPPILAAFDEISPNAKQEEQMAHAQAYSNGAVHETNKVSEFEAKPQETELEEENGQNR